jgi:hypothetical protein
MKKIIKIILVSLFIVLAILLLVFLRQEPKMADEESEAIENSKDQELNNDEKVDKNSSFETIDQGFYSSISEKNTYVINSLEEWQNIWSQAYSNQTPEPELPAIDFEKETVIAVFAGEFPSGGYEVEIDRLDEYDDVVIATFVITSPGPACGTTDALTQPFHIVKTKKTDKEISFVEGNDVDDCE